MIFSSLYKSTFIVFTFFVCCVFVTSSFLMRLSGIRRSSPRLMSRKEKESCLGRDVTQWELGCPSPLHCVWAPPPVSTYTYQPHHILLFAPSTMSRVPDIADYFLSNEFFLQFEVSFFTAKIIINIEREKLFIVYKSSKKFSIYICIELLQSVNLHGIIKREMRFYYLQRFSSR